MVRFGALAQARAVRTSKLLSFGLRHDPRALGLVLDDAGWVLVDLVLAALRRQGELVTRSELEEIVRASDKQRFAVSEDGARTRATRSTSTSGWSPASPRAGSITARSIASSTASASRGSSAARARTCTCRRTRRLR
jgi:RNA:NAD 2'-phosphotransferase (TPT1/KptA family)